MRGLAELCLRKADYARENIARTARFSLAFDQPTFKEFVVRDGENRVRELLQKAAEAGFLAGTPLGTWYPELDDCFLVAVTEKRTRAEIDHWALTLDS